MAKSSINICSHGLYTQGVVWPPHTLVLAFFWGVKPELINRYSPCPCKLPPLLSRLLSYLPATGNLSLKTQAVGRSPKMVASHSCTCCSLHGETWYLFPSPWSWPGPGRLPHQISTRRQSCLFTSWVIEPPWRKSRPCCHKMGPGWWDAMWKRVATPRRCERGFLGVSSPALHQLDVAQ